ncbi:MAG: hypothetical protein KAR37_09900 [Alphaproteobacteria bacterium]|nr:hypothetical protein [Alphaproteobacteria bacterium]
MNKLLQGRQFQFWEYRVSHGSLFLRSPTTGGFKTNVDVTFVGVEFIALPRFLFEIDIVEPTAAEVEYVNDKLPPDHKLRNLYIVLSRGRRFPIAASGMMIEENELEMFESAFAEFRERDANQLLT